MGFRRYFDRAYLWRWLCLWRIRFWPINKISYSVPSCRISLANFCAKINSTSSGSAVNLYGCKRSAAFLLNRRFLEFSKAIFYVGYPVKRVVRDIKSRLYCPKFSLYRLNYFTHKARPEKLNGRVLLMTSSLWRMPFPNGFQPTLLIYERPAKRMVIFSISYFLYLFLKWPLISDCISCL